MTRPCTNELNRNERLPEIVFLEVGPSQDHQIGTSTNSAFRLPVDLSKKQTVWPNVGGPIAHCLIAGKPEK